MSFAVSSILPSCTSLGWTNRMSSRMPSSLRRAAQTRPSKSLRVTRRWVPTMGVWEVSGHSLRIGRFVTDLETGRRGADAGLRRASPCAAAPPAPGGAPRAPAARAPRSPRSSIATRSASHLRSSSDVRYSQVAASIGPDRAPVARDAAGDLVGRRVQRQPCLVSVGRAADALLDVGGGVLGGQPARREAGPHRRRPFEAVDPERPPVPAALVPGDEVPAPAVVDDRVRLDLAPAVGAVAAAIREAQALGVAACRRDHGEVLRIHRRARGGEREGRRAERTDPATQVRRQHLLELDERPHGRLLDAGHRRASRGAQPHRDRDRLLVVEQQRRHGASRSEAVPAGGAGEGLDGIAKPAQPLDVAPDRAAGDLEALGQLGARPVAASLKEGEELQQPA